MSDTTEGSSNAAQSAQSEDTDNQGGFFKRLFSSHSPIIDHDLAAAQANGSIPEGGLGNLFNLRVMDVAVPRADIAAVANDLDLSELVKVFRDSNFTRLPVYQDSLDTPLGFIHLKDVALKHGFSPRPRKLNMKQMMRPLIYAPPSMPLGVLLQKMQAQRTHIALVIDEYGGVDGLLTIEDLIEQVVGEITDEHDEEEEQSWVEESPGVFLCLARANLQEFEKVLGVQLLPETDAEDIDTLGGLAVMLSGNIPTRGEVLKHPSGYDIEIVEADPRRIKRVRVRKSKAAA
jgi:magnesium and cobalt transporter